MNVDEIKAALVAQGETPAAIEAAINSLTELIESDNTAADDTLYIERGKLYWRLGDRARCITDYNRAAEINPDGDAPNLLKMTYDILNFYNKDLYNP